MGECISNNDPISDIMDKWLLSVAGAKLPKVFVAKLCTVAGDHRLAKKILATLKMPGVSKVTSLPASVSAALRAPPTAARVLHGLGAGAGFFWQSYGLYMASVEAACIGHCCASYYYDYSSGIALPVDVNMVIQRGVDAFDRAIRNVGE